MSYRYIFLSLLCLFPLSEACIDTTIQVNLNESLTGDQIICGSVFFYSQYATNCPDGMECNVAILDNAYSGGPTTVNCSYPSNKGAGEPCKTPNECNSSACTSEGVCWGKKAEGTCSSNLECERGNYCKDTGKCAQLPNIGDPCGTNYSCPTYATCVNNATCVLKYSILDGDPVDIDLNTPNYIWWGNNVDVCVSGWANTNPTDGSKAICTKGPHLITPTKTTIITPCEYINYTNDGTQDTFDINSACGYLSRSLFSDTQTGYCVPGAGDLTSKLADLKEYFGQQIQCNLGAGQFCRAAEQANKKKYMKAVEAYYYINEFGHISDIPDYVEQNIPINKYLEAKHYNDMQAFYFWGSIGLGGTLLLALAAWAIYYFLLK